MRTYAQRIAVALLIVLSQIGYTFAQVADQGTPRFGIEIKGPKGSTKNVSGDRYGPIRDEDTLWAIAKRFRPNSSISMYQVMVAIYRTNPNAFVDGNLNYMKNDVILQIPSASFMRSINLSEARNMVVGAQPVPPSSSSADRPIAQTAAKPAVESAEPVAKQQDLEKAKRDLERKLTELNIQQQQQFGSMRDQFKDSIDGMQSLLDENANLKDRLDGVNQEVQQLKVQLSSDGELQKQMELEISKIKKSA